MIIDVERIEHLFHT